VNAVTTCISDLGPNTVVVILALISAISATAALYFKVHSDVSHERGGTA